MKQILTILFLFACIAVKAQYIPNSGAYQYKGIKTTNSLQPPTGTGSPGTLLNAPDSGYSAFYYNKADTSLYLFNPVTKTWNIFTASGGGGGSSDLPYNGDSSYYLGGDTILHQFVT